MKKRTISLLAFALATTVSLTACTGAKVVAEKGNEIEESLEQSYVEVVEEKIASNNLAFMVLLEEYYKSGKNIYDILNEEDKNSVLYSSALYVKLRNYGLDDETILRELHNVVTFGLVHPFEDGWKNDLLVENLNKSIDYNGDAIIFYYPLAAYTHLFDCRLVHETVEDRIKCDQIEEDLFAMNDNLLFANYVVEDVLSMEDDNPLKIALMRIINSKEDTKTCILELEYIYELGMVPRCASEEEWALISHLDATTEEMENPFEVYYDLAVYVHTLQHEADHYQNEFGQWECEAYRKR